MNYSDHSRVGVLDLNRPPEFSGLCMLGPGDDPAEVIAAGDLVLGIGLSGEQAVRAVQGARSVVAGTAPAAVGLVLRPKSAAADRAVEAALATSVGDCDVHLYWLAARTSWAHAHRQLAEHLDTSDYGGSPNGHRSGFHGGRAAGDRPDLADLAQTIATLTGGLVTIEDTSARVLAYSRSSDEVDDLRRLSILGRSGPPEYLSLLRQWGIYDRLAASEEVVEIAEHPETGIRRRLAVGIFAGRRQLGTIWVQQGSATFPPHATQALLGAARVTAAQLVDSRSPQAQPGPNRYGMTAGADSRSLELVLAADATALAALPARLTRQPCVVTAFDLGEPALDRTAARLALDELLAIVSVHGAALRRDAMTAILDNRCYLLLPAVDSARLVIPTLQAALAAAHTHLDVSVRCAIGPVASALSSAGGSRAGADLVLTESGSGPTAAGTLLSFDGARAGLAVRAAVEAFAGRPDLADHRLTQLVDTEPDFASTLLHFLDHGSQISVTAQALGIHPTTVRYRLRKAVDLTGLELAEPDQRLAAQLQLRALS
jgi:hypothetical protein